MRKLFFLFLNIFLTAGVACAQPKGFTQVKNAVAFQQAMAQANALVQTIESDFTQVKNMKVLNDKIRSRGKFYFKKEDKVRIEYTSPYSYLLVMNGSQILVKDENKSSRINTGSSKTMQSVNRIMLDCMRGTVFRNPDFKTTAYESGQQYLLTMIPANESMRRMFTQIDVYLSKKNFDVDRLTMTEKGGDFTDMDFSNTQHNKALNEALFKTK